MKTADINPEDRYENRDPRLGDAVTATGAEILAQIAIFGDDGEDWQLEEVQTAGKITMYEKTIMKAYREDCQDNDDIAALAERLPAYLDDVASRLEAQGYEVEREDEAPTPGACYHVEGEDPDGYEAIAQLPSIWD